MDTKTLFLGMEDNLRSAWLRIYLQNYNFTSQICPQLRLKTDIEILGKT